MDLYIFTIALITIILLPNHAAPAPATAEIQDAEEIDSKFLLNPEDIEKKQLSQNVALISGAVMGIAELVLGIKSDVKLLRSEIMMGKSNMRFEGRGQPVEFVQIFNEIEQTSNQGNFSHTPPNVDYTNEEIRLRIQTNFVKILSAMLVNGPPSTRRRKGDIIKLMRDVLNGKVDFKAIVEKLPFVLSDSQTNEFVQLIQTIQEDGFPKFRQDDEDDGGEEEQEIATAAPPQYFLITQNQPQPQVQPQVQPQTSKNSLNTTAANPVQASIPPNNTQAQPMQPQGVTQIIIQQQPQTQRPAPTQPPRQSYFSQALNAISQLDVNQLQSFLGAAPDIIDLTTTIVDNAGGLIDFE